MIHTTNGNAASYSILPYDEEQSQRASCTVRSSNRDTGKRFRPRHPPAECLRSNPIVHRYSFPACSAKAQALEFAMYFELSLGILSVVT